MPTTITPTFTRPWAGRHARIKAVFVETAVASTAALNALLVSIYRHAPESLAHAHRVASLGTSIARELRLREREIEDLERAAWTHDLGNFVAPSADGQETASYWTEQLFAAADILGSVPFLAPAANLVLASRECIDGSGYPYGLSGPAIPLGARIIHVADAYDALAAVCSSLNVGRDAADDEIVRHAGTRFDPDVVAACLRSIDTTPVQALAGAAAC